LARALTSSANPLVKRLRALGDRKGRRIEGLFLAEGLRVVTDAVEAGRAPAILALAPEAVDHPLARRAANAARGAGGAVAELPLALIGRITGKDNPAQVLAAFPIPDTPLGALDRAAAPVWLVAHEPRDPGNVGTMLRSCDAAGAGGLILLDHCADPFGVEAVRASMGAIFTVRLARASSAGFLAWLRAGPGFLAGAVLSADAQPWDRIDYPPPTFLLVGTEQAGLPAHLAGACDARVMIPMAGQADSLNVAVAAAVLLFETVRQRRQGGSGSA
jgi:TrmH family RNA methyltransferase